MTKDLYVAKAAAYMLVTKQNMYILQKIFDYKIKMLVSHY